MTKSNRPDGAVIPSPPEPPLPIAISACLAGRAVRYDGTDARASFPHEAFEELVSFVPICPEVGIGMGVPRPPIQLVGDPAAPRVLGVRDPSLDVTRALDDYARAQSVRLKGVYGYVFMERSPSCGVHSVAVYAPENGELVSRTGRGGFARAVSAQHPQLPIEENGRLFDASVRESFLARVFAFAHWRRLCDSGLTPARLMEFHSRYKYLLMAHSVPHYRQAGRLLGHARERGWRLNTESRSPHNGNTASRYLACLMAGLSRPATRGGHANALSHMQGYLKRHLGPAERRELAEQIEAYRTGHAPLAAPRQLLLHHLASHPFPYLRKQAYLGPLAYAPNSKRCAQPLEGNAG